MSPEPEAIEAYFELKGDTDDAVLVTDGINEIWLPKSQISMNHIQDHDYEITMPEWLAYKEGII